MCSHATVTDSDLLSLIGTYDWDLYFYLLGCSTHQNLMSCSRILNSIKGFKLKQLQWSNITGELIDQLAAMRQAFGYAGLARSTPPLVTGTQPTASTSRQPDDLLPKQPAPKTVQYQSPSFKLTRPMAHLTMNERVQVHHNYISAVSSLEHKKTSSIG